MSEPRFMKISAFAAYVGIDESMVRKLMKQGLPHVRITPRNPRIIVSDAIAWFSARKVMTGAEGVLH